MQQAFSPPAQHQEHSASVHPLLKLNYLQQQTPALNLPFPPSGLFTAPPSNASDHGPAQPPFAHSSIYLHNSTPPPPPLSAPPEQHTQMHPQAKPAAHPSQMHAPLNSGPTMAMHPNIEAPRTLPPFDPAFANYRHLFGGNPGALPQGPPFGSGQGPPGHGGPPTSTHPSNDGDLLSSLAPHQREDIRSRLPPEFASHFGLPAPMSQLPGVPASGSLSPRSLLHYHQQQLQVQQAMALAAAQNGKGGLGVGPSGQGGNGLNNNNTNNSGLPGGLGGNIDPGKLPGGPFDMGLPPLGRFGPPQSATPGPGQGLQRPPSAAGRALAGALAGTSLMSMGIGGPGPLSLANTGGPPSGPPGGGAEEITTVFIVGFPDDMTERELNNMFLFARGFEAATLKIPPAINHQASAGGPYNVVNLQGPGTSGLDPSLAPNGFGDGDAFSSPFGGGPNMQGNAGPKNLKNIIGFAKFRTRADALAARDALNGRKIDAERGCVVKTEMAKKNLHTKQRAPGTLTGGGGGGGGSSGPSGNSGTAGNHPQFGPLSSFGTAGNEFGHMSASQHNAERGNRQSDPNAFGGQPGGYNLSQFTSPAIGGPSQGGGDFDSWPSQRPLSPPSLSGHASHIQSLMQQQARLQHEHDGQQEHRAPSRADFLRNLPKAQGLHQGGGEDSSRSGPPSGRQEGWPASLGPLDYFPGDLESSLHESMRIPSPLKGDHSAFAPFSSKVSVSTSQPPSNPATRGNPSPPAGQPDWTHNAPQTGGSNNLPPRLNPGHDYHLNNGREVPATPGSMRSPMSPHNFAAFPSNLPPGFHYAGSNNHSPPHGGGQGHLDAGAEARNRSPPAALDMDSVTNLEEGSFQRGFGGGHDHGRLHGTFEGRSLGREKGFEVWDEVGYYEGVAQFWHNALEEDPSSNSRKLGRQRLQLNELQRLISAFPQINKSSQDGGDGPGRRSSPSQRDVDESKKPDDPMKDLGSMDINNLLEHIRARFKITASLLGIPPKFQQQVPPAVESEAKASGSGAGQASGSSNTGPGRPHQLSGGQVVDTQQLGF